MRSLLCAVFLFMTPKVMAHGLAEPERLPLAKMDCDQGITAVYGFPKASGRTFYEGRKYKSIYVVDPDGLVELYIRGDDGEPIKFFCKMAFWRASY